MLYIFGNKSLEVMTDKGMVSLESPGKAPYTISPEVAEDLNSVGICTDNPDHFSVTGNVLDGDNNCQ